jgi:hypothetical protein
VKSQEEKNFDEIANRFEDYFSKIGFYVILKAPAIRVVKMEHKNGMDVTLSTSYSGLDFVIHGWSFNADKIA